MKSTHRTSNFLASDKKSYSLYLVLVIIVKVIRKKVKDVDGKLTVKSDGILHTSPTPFIWYSFTMLFLTLICQLFKRVTRMTT